MLKKISDNINIIIEKFGILNGSLDENKTKLQTTFGEVGANALAKFYNVIKESDLNKNSLNSEDITKIQNTLSDLSIASENASTSISEAGRSAEESAQNFVNDTEKLNEFKEQSFVAGNALGEIDSQMIRLSQSSETLKEKIDRLNSDLSKTGQNIVNFAQATTTAVMLSSSLTNAITSLGDNTISVSQKMTSSLTALTGVLYNLSNTINIISKEGWAAAASNIYLLALMVIITTIQSVLKYLEKLRKKRIEASKASIEMTEKSKEEVSSNKELCDS